MNPIDQCISETNRNELAAGVLKQAAQDLRRFHLATSAVEREIYRDAYRWLTADDYSWPFSFLNVCQILGLTPETVRQELLRDMTLGVVGYWTRCCARGAHRLQTFLSRSFSNGPRRSVAESVTVAQSTLI